jgi:DNA (cytosine-5)-methyltransferase 1
MRNEKHKFKMIDLCAGTGAFTYAFEKTDCVDVIFANDFDSSSKHIYDLNFSHSLTFGDLCEMDVKDIPKHDIMSCGFPCQPFSVVGLQKGFDDKRTDIIWKLLEIMDYHKPECVILENVKNLISHDHEKTFTIIKNAIKKTGYNIIYNVLDTSQITKIPQHRERIYIICVRNKNIFKKMDLDFPIVSTYEMDKILEKNVEKKYYYDDKNNKIHKLLMKTVKNKNTFYQYRRTYVRENKRNVCQTLTKNMGTGGYNVPIICDEYGVRKLTPRECFNLQGFPKDYNLNGLCDSKLYGLSGNAITVPIVELIANRLIPLMNKFC